MKIKLFFLSLFFVSMIHSQENKNNREAVKFQNKLNKEFGAKEKSPLTAEDQKTFKELSFYPIDSTFRVAAQLKFHENSEPFKMKTTTDRLPVYKLYATASFTINDKAYELEIYQNEKLILTTDYEDYLFLPFTDNSNGKGSYGGGRYIDLAIPESDTMIIDFNQAYNPYCTYNKKYSCPIPPEVNHLNIEIKAGVMDFEH